MAANASSAAESSSVPAGQTGPQLVPGVKSACTTVSRRITNEMVAAFIESTGDNNSIHMDDAVARALPLPQPLTGRIVHGKLVQCVAIDLLRRGESNLRPDVVPMIIRENWDYERPVYPDEEIFVEYSRPTAMRIGRPIAFDVCVCVQRQGITVVVQKGRIMAFPTQTIGT